MAKFIDYTNVVFKAGDGGNGIVSFHREKFVDKGGPSGGDGGNGGSIFLVGNSNESTLYNFKYKKIIKAENGLNGESAMKHGRNGNDLFVDVPLGTVVKKDNERLGEILEHGQSLLVVRGGRGGRGNAKFKSSVNTVPRLSENGMTGEEFTLDLELKVLADVALVGYPSVGKSTIISMITNVKPKIAEYHFTTLIPNIGVSSYKDKNFVVADIPGLISGAADGKGLGHEFLRHIERCKFILHIIDSTLPIEEIKEKYDSINFELSKYSQKLSNLEQKIVVNKIDSIDKDKLEIIKKDFPNAILVSSFNKDDMEKLKSLIATELQDKKYETVVEEKKFNYYRYNPNKKEIEVIRLSEDAFEVRGSLIDYWARRIPITTDQNYSRFRQKLISSGIFKMLEKQGWKDGDSIEISINGEIYEFE
ncbi:MAG: GTPase ObgE [Mycoplasmataceae bacterium]|nr:GTPase ObgE [Mycoplasmataceae bacterium]